MVEHIALGERTKLLIAAMVPYALIFHNTSEFIHIQNLYILLFIKLFWLILFFSMHSVFRRLEFFHQFYLLGLFNLHAEGSIKSLSHWIMSQSHMTGSEGFRDKAKHAFCLLALSHCIIFGKDSSMSAHSFSGKGHLFETFLARSLLLLDHKGSRDIYWFRTKKGNTSSRT